MAWVTEISADEQVDYRLGRQAGCGVADDAGTHLETDEDRPVDYRLESADGVLVWIGSGLEDVGLTAGAALTAEGGAAARRLMKGCHPLTGARLITGRTRSAPTRRRRSPWRRSCAPSRPRPPNAASSRRASCREPKQLTKL
ncbi:hypothetical protein [Streptomyces sp. UH6]|uniref:hypothetical protein n=1 Tax=Streptomyces sp. UH6 TaxID=2748379 RepID=UPI0015D49EA7|nr:hypothetical protein [Streptomyces sp. UH6]NYV73532.1 hypothetical protein [Streptomyces sp. UH6]